MDKKKATKKKAKKKASEILYHYCSNNAFHAIVVNRSIRLSSLSLSNDSMEGKLVAEVMRRLAKADNLSNTAIDRLQDSFSNLEKCIDGLGFCLSEKGDLLSQWRGYAADATGVSIGFAKDYLKQLSNAGRLVPEKPGFTLQKVVYKPDIQERLITPTYMEIKKLIDDGAFKYPARNSLLCARSDNELERDNKKFKRAFSSLSFAVLGLFAKLFLLKTNAFSEEKEWRLISYLVKKGDSCSFRALNDRIIPFREFELQKLKNNSIMEVILGPKNMTPNHVIESLLKQNGFPNVKVKQSEASYR